MRMGKDTMTMAEAIEYLTNKVHQGDELVAEGQPALIRAAADGLELLRSKNERLRQVLLTAVEGYSRMMENYGSESMVVSSYAKEKHEALVNELKVNAPYKPTCIKCGYPMYLCCAEHGSRTEAVPGSPD
jgi:ABC-type transporter Mla subunit MlaD